MAQIDDTPDAPESAGQQAEPTTQAAEPEITEQAGVVTPPPDAQVSAPAEEQPPQLTADEIIRQAEERSFQRTASWIGRRDKDLLDNIGNLINSRIPKQQYQPPPQPKVDPAALLDNPGEALRQMGFVSAADVPRLVHETIGQATAAEQRYNADLIQNAAALMDSDPMFADKNLGNAVVNEIQQSFATIDRRLPPQVAAQLLVNGAVTNIARKATMAKSNPLAGNKPVSGPMGTVKPPVAPAAKAKPIKLSAETAALAKRWNYSQDDLARVFGTEI
jgi:hypothetical protein